MCRIRRTGSPPAGNGRTTTAAPDAMNEGGGVSRGSIRGIEIVPPTDDEPKNQTAQAADQNESQLGEKIGHSGIGTCEATITFSSIQGNTNNNSRYSYRSPKKYVISKGCFPVFSKIDMPWQTEYGYYYISP